MNPYRLLILFSVMVLNAVPGRAQITANSAIQAEIDKVSGISDDLAVFESFGLKEDGLPGLTQTLDWLESRYDSMGFTDVLRDSFQHPVSSSYNINLVVTKEGTDTTLPVLVICSHYDTRSGPGVNDNGTGVAATLQIAERVSRLNLPRGIKFIHFAAEEDGLFGSTHYVNNVIGSSASIYLVINLDQLGGTASGPDNDKIVCERDETPPLFNDLPSRRFTDTLSEMISLYTTLTPFMATAFNSDYMPFQDKGYVITGLWQFDGNQYPFYHKAGDSLKQVDTMATLEVTKGALAAVLYWSGSPEFAGVKMTAKRGIGVYPNPVSDHLFISLPVGSEYILTITDAMGRVVREYHRPGGELKLEADLAPGIYCIRARNPEKGEQLSGKFIIR